MSLNVSSPATYNEPASPSLPISSVLSALWFLSPPPPGSPHSSLFAPVTELSGVQAMVVGLIIPD